MDTENTATVSKDTVAVTSQYDQGGVKITDDINKSMTNKAINVLHQSGSGVGFINLNTVTKEVLFAQIRMLRKLMFDVVPLSRYDHLVGN